MGAPKGFIEHCAVMAGGLLGSAGIPLLFSAATGGTGAGLLVAPIADFCKDLFKGIGGDHIPRFNRAVRERLKGIDPTALNHHIRGALQEALRATEITMRHWYKKKHGPLSDEGRAYLKEFCKAIGEQLETLANGSPARAQVDEWLGKSAVPGQETLVRLCALDRERITRKAPDLDKVITEHFFSDLQLHFAEYIKNPDHHEARVAFEQLTTDTLLAEVKGLGEKLKTLDTIDAKLDELLAGLVVSGEAPLAQQNVTQWQTAHREVEVREVVSLGVSEGLGRLEGRMEELHALMHDVGARIVMVQDGVGTTVKQSRISIWLILLVLAGVCGIALLIILNPFQERTFALKVQVDQPFDYGSNDVVARLLAIEYSGTLRDTQEVINGLVSFTIPESSRNDDVVMHLLCQDSGRASTSLRLCDSMQRQLSDKERLLFTSVQPPATAKQGSKPEKNRENSAPADLAVVPATAAPASVKAACPLDAAEFRSEGSFEDKLVLVAGSGGLVSISGEVNRKGVQGTLRASGNRLTARKGGTLLGGALTLLDCAQLTGSLEVRTLSGATENVQVNMRDVRR